MEMQDFQPDVDQIDLIRDVFNRFSSTNSMTKPELAALFAKLGYQMTDLDLDVILASVDKDKDGVLSFDEFAKVIFEFSRETDGILALREAFEIFDVNGDGFISAAELKHVLAHIGCRLDSDEIDLILNESGMSMQGKIGYRDFVDLMNK